MPDFEKRPFKNTESSDQIKSPQNVKHHPALGGYRLLSSGTPDIPLSVLAERLEHLIIDESLPQEEEPQQVIWAIATFLYLFPWNPPATSHVTLATAKGWDDSKTKAAQISQQIQGQKNNCGSPVITPKEFMEH